MTTPFRKVALAAAAMVAASGFSTSASAAHVICNGTQLANASGATSCSYVTGNANSNSAAHRSLQSAAIGSLGASDFVFDMGTNSANSYLAGTDAISLGATIDFGREMFGETIIALHFGNGVGTPWRPTKKSAGNSGGVTAFYLFNFATPTSSITLNNASSLSNAHLYTTQGAVPEPSTWTLLILGFFGLGSILRRSNRRQLTVRAA